MNERFYIDPENAKCPDCDGGTSAHRFRTCTTCGGFGTWEGALRRVVELDDRVKDMESDLKDAREEIADLKAEMEA